MSSLPPPPPPPPLPTITNISSKQDLKGKSQFLIDIEQGVTLKQRPINGINHVSLTDILLGVYDQNN